MTPLQEVYSELEEIKLRKDEANKEKFNDKTQCPKMVTLEIKEAKPKIFRSSFHTIIGGPVAGDKDQTDYTPTESKSNQM